MGRNSCCKIVLEEGLRDDAVEVEVVVEVRLRRRCVRLEGGRSRRGRLNAASLISASSHSSL
jgi:hypothetical protein